MKATMSINDLERTKTFQLVLTPEAKKSREQIFIAFTFELKRLYDVAVELDRRNEKARESLIAEVNGEIANITRFADATPELMTDPIGYGMLINLVRMHQELKALILSY